MKFDDRGLVPAIIQDANSDEVLTLAYMNDDSLRRTIETRKTWLWSRSRNELWQKGATSGNTQVVVDVAVDCDDDAVLLRVRPSGPACHKGETSCFHTSVFKNDEVVSTPDFGRQLQDLYKVIESRKRDRPEGSYTSYLFNEGLDKILKKVGEEAAETIVAAKNDDDQKFVSEVSDLIYHLIVLLAARGATLDQIALELNRRGSDRRC